jgi:hypothetical protein
MYLIILDSGLLGRGCFESLGARGTKMALP